MPDVQDPPRRIKTASWWLQVATAFLVGGLLVGVGTIAFRAEFYNPGVIIPNVSRIIALILAFIALDSPPVNWGGLAFLLFILDLKIAGFALSVAAGTVSLVLGSLLLFPFVNNVVFAHDGARDPSPVADRLGAKLSFSFKVLERRPVYNQPINKNPFNG
jgi:hypothetical protein